MKILSIENSHIRKKNPVMNLSTSQNLLEFNKNATAFDLILNLNNIELFRG